MPGKVTILKPIRGRGGKIRGFKKVPPPKKAKKPKGTIKAPKRSPAGDASITVTDLEILVKKAEERGVERLSGKERQRLKGMFPDDASDRSLQKSATKFLMDKKMQRGLDKNPGMIIERSSGDTIERFEGGKPKKTIKRKKKDAKRKSR